MAVNGADSGGGVGRRGQGPFERGCICRWNCDQWPATGLRVAQHHLVEHCGAPPIDLVAIRIVVAAAAPWKEGTFGRGANAVEEWGRAQFGVGGTPEIGEGPDRPLARYTRSRVRARAGHGFRTPLR